MYAHRLDDKKHIEVEVWSAPGLTKPLFDEAKKQKYKPAHKGEMFGPSWVSVNNSPRVFPASARL